MHPTNRLPRLTLSYRRAEVAGFWIVIAVVGAFLTGVTAAVLGAAQFRTWAAGAAVMLLLPATMSPRWSATGVRMWNGGVRRTTATLRTYVLSVCYRTVLVAVRCAGASLDLESRSAAKAPGWIALTPDGRSPDHGLLGAARRPGSGWLIALLPAMVLLGLLNDEAQGQAPSGSTYTLF